MGLADVVRKTLERMTWMGRKILICTAHFGWRRGLTIAWADRPHSRGELTVCWPGYSTPFVLRRGATDLRTFVQVIAEEGYAMATEHQPRVIFDVGANVGCTTVYYANHYPEALVVAVEPEYNNFAVLERNTRYYENIRRVQAALWNTAGTVRLVDPGLGSWGFAVAGDQASHPSVMVDAVTVDGLMDRFDVSFVDILKLDIEGAEAEIFASADKWIDRIGMIAIELHDRLKPGCSRSFFAATEIFGGECWKGETVFVWRERDEN